MEITFEALNDTDEFKQPYVVAHCGGNRYFARPNAADLAMLEAPPRDASKLGGAWELLRRHHHLVQHVMIEKITSSHEAGEIRIVVADLFSARGRD